MKKPFASLHARTFCHATENLDKVMSALENTVGRREVDISRTEGHYGNPIMILETVLKDMDEIDEFFSRLGDDDLNKLLSSLSSRIDDGCNLFVRIDKQAAFRGEIKLGGEADVISVRIHVRSFPAKCDIAIATTRNYLISRLAGESEQAPSQ